ncbi:MAG: hypothetical protein ABW252_20870 [Polyangiales bacterium]
MDRALPWLAVGLTLLLVWLGIWLETKLRVLRERKKSREQAKRGFQGEKDAEKLVKKLGYTILSRHAPASYAMTLDGEPHAVQLQADFVLQREGKKFVAEVKTGKAAKLEQAAETRRQMLEYQLAFGVDAMLLIDADAKVVRMVRFPLPKKKVAAASPVKRATLRWTAIGVVALTTLWLLAHRGEEPPAAAGAPSKHAR